MKTNSAYKYGMFHVGRTDMWGNYCPETGECYLAHKIHVPGIGTCVEVLASVCEMPDGSIQEQCAWGYDYNSCEVVRELLQLGHLTKKTLADFILAGGDVWWDQPNYSKEV